MFNRRKMLLWTAASAVLPGLCASVPAWADDAVKIGLILPMTGGQASTGKQIDNAIKLYMQQKGDTVAGKKIEVILKDDGAVPDNTKRIAQELNAGSPPPRPSNINPGSNRALGYALMIQFGWPASQWPALDALWNRESGWDQYADNVSSHAYGIPQSLPATKMAVVGPDWQTNPSTQIRWGLAYIGQRYGSPDAAWAHEVQVGWY